MSKKKKKKKKKQKEHKWEDYRRYEFPNMKDALWWRHSCNEC